MQISSLDLHVTRFVEAIVFKPIGLKLIEQPLIGFLEDGYHDFVVMGSLVVLIDLHS